MALKIRLARHKRRGGAKPRPGNVTRDGLAGAKTLFNNHN